MKVTLFGATGKTGPALIEEGLRRGLKITVFARKSSSFESKNARVVKGDLTDVNALRDAIHGSVGVLSALGPTRIPHQKGMPITQATASIITAMMQEQKTRLVAVSTGTAVDPGDGRDLKIWLPALLIKYAMPSVYDDIVGVAHAIRSSSVDWTMVRAAVLKDRAEVGELNVGLYGHTKHSLTLSRAELARFMFDQLESRTYMRQAPGISSRR